MGSVRPKKRSRSNASHAVNRSAPGGVFTPAQVASIARSVLASQSETKFLETFFNVTNLAYDAATISSVTDIAVGTSDQQRVGDSLHVTSIKGCLSFTNYSATTFSRAMLIQWRGDQSLPTLGNLVPAAGGTPGSSTVFASRYAHDRRVQFSVLWDSGAFGLAGGSTGNGITYCVKKFDVNVGLIAKRSKRVKADVKYVAGTTAFLTNGFALVAWSNRTAAQADGPTMVGSVCVNFRDL